MMVDIMYQHLTYYYVYKYNYEWEINMVFLKRAHILQLSLPAILNEKSELKSISKS